MFRLQTVEDLKNRSKKTTKRPQDRTTNIIVAVVECQNDHRTKHSNRHRFKEIINLNAAICAKSYYCYTVLDVVG